MTEFQKLVGSEAERIGADKFCERYCCSKSTLRRWIAGKSKPVPVMMELITCDINKRRKLYEQI